MRRPCSSGIFFILLIHLQISIQFEANRNLWTDTRLPGSVLDCWKYYKAANNLTLDESPAMSGRNGWNGIYTDSKGISRLYSWKERHEKPNIFYYNCSAKYPLVFDLLPGVQECEMSKALQTNMKYHLQILDEHSGSFVHVFSTWAKVTGPPMIVGVSCRGACNTMKTEAYYSFNSYEIPGLNKTVDESTQTFHTKNGGTIGLTLNPVEYINFEEVCLEQYEDDKIELEETWAKFYPIVRVGIAILLFPVVSVLIIMIIAHFWFVCNCPGSDEHESGSIRDRQPNRPWLRSESMDETGV